MAPVAAQSTGANDIVKPAQHLLAQSGCVAPTRHADEAATYSFTFTWKPASFSAFTSAEASKSPSTVNSVIFDLAVSLVTPGTALTAALMALLQRPQQS